MNVSYYDEESQTAWNMRTEVHQRNKIFAYGNSEPHLSLGKTTYE